MLLLLWMVGTLAPSRARRYFYNNNARKVPYYFAYADWMDSNANNSGHGTHTSCTLAGAQFGFNPVATPDYATGATC